MAIMDKKLQMSDAQSLATAAGNTVYSTDVIDLGAASPNIGKGNPVYAHVRIGTAVAGSASATLQAKVQHSADNSSFADLITATAATPGALAAGVDVIDQALPGDVDRYVRCAFAVATSAVSAGTADAWIDLGQSGE